MTQTMRTTTAADFIGPVVHASIHRQREAFRLRLAQAAENHRCCKLKSVAIATPIETNEQTASPVDQAVADTSIFVESEIKIEGKILRIQRLICERLHIHMCDLLSASRVRECVMARQIGMFLCFESTPNSYPDIGRRFGGRDHTTVMHAVRRVKAMVSMPSGTSISPQWLVKECDIVRRHVSDLRAIIQTWA